MNNLQWLVYVSGIIAFCIGCFFYFVSKKDNLDNKQIKIRKRLMNFFLIISLACLGYSWL